MRMRTEVGGTYTYEWESDDDGSRFGFTGELRNCGPVSLGVD